MLDKYGFEQKDWEDMLRVFRSFPELEKVILFGSRALNTFKAGSDVDIALVPNKESPHLTAAVKGALEETQLPYFFDVVDYSKISTPEFKEHIERFGNTLYAKSSSERLGDILKLNYGKGLVAGCRKAGTVPVYGSSGITGFHNEPLVNKRGIIVGRKGNVGTVYLSEVPFYPIDTVFYITQDDTKCDLDFLYYFLQSLGLQKMNTDAAVPGLSREGVYSIEVVVPEVDEQKRIAQVFSSVDNKINLLNEQNQTLEGIAQRLFREWFVEFNFPNEEGKPYRKSGGEMIETSLGKIPASWEVMTLDQLIYIDPKEKISKASEYLFYDMKCLSKDSLLLEGGEKKKSSSGSVFRVGDTLFAKITPCLENGKTGLVLDLGDQDIARGSTEFLVLRPKNDFVSAIWIYCLARSEKFRDFAIKSMTGTSGRQRVQVSQLKQYDQPINENVGQMFAKVFQPSLEKIKSNAKEILILNDLKSKLLNELL